MRLPSFALGLGLLAAAGCSSDSAADRLRFNLNTGGGPVQVDTVCGGVCGGGDQLEVGIGYASEGARGDETIELHQYRVDYHEVRFVGEVPFFAGTLSVAIGPGENRTAVLTVAGTAQRNHIRDAIGGDPVSGTATLTFAGYDWDGEQFTAESVFDIRFADLPDGASTQVGGSELAADEPADGGAAGEGGGHAAAP